METGIERRSLQKDCRLEQKEKNELGNKHIRVAPSS
jgi:hypothetical protein